MGIRVEICVFFMFLFSIQGQLGAVSNSKRLFDFLFAEERYSPQLLPDCGTYRGTNVSFNLALRQIIDLDEKAQMLSVNAWIRMTWNDCSLVWNTTQYGDIQTILVDYAHVWVPDIAIYDSLAEEEMMPGLDRFKARIRYDGTVTYLFPTVLRTICRVKVTYFPFDIQICELTFGSWSHVITEIDFFPGLGNGLPGKGDDVNNYKENNEWRKISFTSEFENLSFPVGNFRLMTYHLRLGRRPVFYILIMVFPCIFVSFVALLGCCLPAESGEKVSLEVTILLSLAVFLLVISDLLPPDSDNYPLLGLYFASSMVLVGLRLVACIFVLYIHHSGRTGKTVPHWARRFLLGRLGKFFCERNESESRSSKKYTVEKKVDHRKTEEFYKKSNRLKTDDSIDQEESSFTTNIHGTEREEAFAYNKQRANTEDALTNNLHNTDSQRAYTNNIQLRSIPNDIHTRHGDPDTTTHGCQTTLQADCFSKIIHHLGNADSDICRDNEWMRLARIVDRMTVVLYSIAYATLLIVFLVQITTGFVCPDGETHCDE